MSTAEIIPPSILGPVPTAFEAEKGEEDDFDSGISSPTRHKLFVDLQGTKDGGLGMVIVGGYKDGKQFGIFVKSIRETGPVFKDGRIHVGDQLLSANGKSLIGISNDQAVQSLKQCALTDKVVLEIVRDVAARSDFKRLSQVMNFNPGETPPEIRSVRHMVIPTAGEEELRDGSPSPSSSLPSVSEASDDEGGGGGLRSSSTPAVLEEEIRQALHREGSHVREADHVSSSLQDLSYYRKQSRDDETPTSSGKDISSTGVLLSLSSPGGREEEPSPPLPASQPPAEEEVTPPPLPVSDPPPIADDSDSESQAPSLPETRPPANEPGDLSLAKDTSFNKRLTFLFPKVLGIGVTVKSGENMPGGQGIYIDKVIRGLDAAKDSNLRPGDQLISVNEESYERLSIEDAKKQLSMLKTKLQLKRYEVVVDREILEEEIGSYEPPLASPLPKDTPTAPPPSDPLPESPPPDTAVAIETDVGGDNDDDQDAVSHASLTPSLPKNSPPSASTSHSSLGQGGRGTPPPQPRPRAAHQDKLTAESGGREPDKVDGPGSIFVAAMLPAEPTGRPAPRESTGPRHRVSIDPATPVRDTPPLRERKERDSSYTARLSLDPNTRVRLTKLEMGLSYTGHNLTPGQKQDLRRRLDVDEHGKVVFADFIDVARDMFAFKLDEAMFEPGSLFSLALSPKESIEPPIFSKGSDREYSMVSTTSDSSHSSRRDSLPAVEDVEQRRQQLYLEGQQSAARALQREASLRGQVQTHSQEVGRLKAKLKESEVVNRQLEVKLQGTQLQASARSSDAESLKKRLALSEAAFKAAKANEGRLSEEIRRLKTDVGKARQQALEQTPAEMKRRMTVMECQIRKLKTSNSRYQVAVEMLLEYCEKSHEALTATADIGPVVFHSRGKGESVRRGDPISGNPRPPQYLAQHAKRTNVSLAQEAMAVVQSARKLLDKDELPFGWEERRTEEGDKYYINHQTQNTTWMRPSNSQQTPRGSTSSQGRVNV